MPGGRQLWAAMGHSKLGKGHEHKKGQELKMFWGSLSIRVAPRSNDGRGLGIHLYPIFLVYRECYTNLTRPITHPSKK